jgi:hypothetical protein
MAMMPNTWIGLELNLSATTASGNDLEVLLAHCGCIDLLNIESPYRDTLILALNSLNQKKKRTAI